MAWKLCSGARLVNVPDLYQSVKGVIQVCRSARRVHTGRGLLGYRGSPYVTEPKVPALLRGFVSARASYR